MGDVGDYWREAKDQRKLDEWKKSMFGAKSERRKCHHPDCHETIPARLYACPRHWRELPHGTRNQIIHGYRGSATVWFRGHKNAQQFWKGEHNE